MQRAQGFSAYGVSPNQLSMAFRRIAKRAKLEDFRLHDLRHTFASYQAMAGVQSRGLQALLGHKDPRMTTRYSHLSDAYLRAAVERVKLGIGNGTVAAAVPPAAGRAESRTGDTRVLALPAAASGAISSEDGTSLAPDGSSSKEQAAK